MIFHTITKPFRLENIFKIIKSITSCPAQKQCTSFHATESKSFAPYERLLFCNYATTGKYVLIFRYLSDSFSDKYTFLTLLLVLAIDHLQKQDSVLN